jgi:hypothetical protein
MVFDIWFALVVIVFIMVVIGSICFWASGFCVFSSVGRACLDFVFLSKKLLFVTKRT